MRQPPGDTERRYWLWVTRPDTYLDEDGNDREDLDPGNGTDLGGWWTCHRDTQKGDLVLLWRTTPRSDIGYLMQAESSAYFIGDDEYASEQGWDDGCDYQVLYKFNNPVTIRDLRQLPYLHSWGAYRANFQRRVYEIPLEHWQRLNKLATDKNPGYREFLSNTMKTPVSLRILVEEQLEAALAQDLSILKRFGHHLDLYADARNGIDGRQVVCKGVGGRIDLLCRDTKRKHLVVIELKNVRAGQNTFGQISTYMGWVQENIAGRTPVIGLVISRGYDAKFQASLKTTGRISHLDVESLGFE